MKQSADFSARSPNSTGKSGHRFKPGDYVGHLLYVEGFRGSHQIKAWRIKLGDFKKIPYTPLCLSLCRQTPV